MAGVLRKERKGKAAIRWDLGGGWGNKSKKNICSARSLRGKYGSKKEQQGGTKRLLQWMGAKKGIPEVGKEGASEYRDRQKRVPRRSKPGGHVPGEEAAMGRKERLTRNSLKETKSPESKNQGKKKIVDFHQGMELERKCCPVGGGGGVGSSWRLTSAKPRVVNPF